MADVDRVAREQAFHDARFAEETRHAAQKYYEANRGAEAWFMSRLVVPPGGRALEFGCGLRTAGMELARQGHRVTAIDISPVAVDQVAEAARAEHLDAFDVEVMNAEALTFADDRFDLVLGTGILHHLDLRAAFAEIARVLKPGGRAVFLEPLGHNPAINLYRRLTPSMRTPDEHPLVRADFGLARASFSEVSARWFGFLSLASVPFRGRSWAGALSRHLERADAVLFERVPVSRALAWTCVVELAAPRTPIARGAR
jgi:SAM-dependent methyltransferase